MICRHYKVGQKLDVAGLNQMIVLLDRGETEMTEVALNEWRPDLDGPPHKHDEKEQIFYITSGEGRVVVGNDEFKVNPGALIHIPVGVVHQTITTGSEPLCYMLFNVFITEDKEGHASFAEHIEKVKNIRKKQAESGKSLVEGAEQTASVQKNGKFFDDIFKAKVYDFGSNKTLLLLDRTESEKCECAVVCWPAGNKGALVAHKEKEQTFFILKGTGKVTVGDETEPVKPGDMVFVPRNIPHTTEAAEEELVYICLNSMVTETADASFDEMYHRIAPQRIERWKSGDTSVGE